MNNLTRRALLEYARDIIGLAILLLVPAWTLDFWQAWVYLSFYAASVALITAYLWKKDPKLLERRLNAGPGAEKEQSQKLIHLFHRLSFFGVILLASLDHRFSWSHVPLVVVIVGNVVVALGFLILFIVCKKNTFAAATIDVTPDQTVISTGPYATVRHPMYSGFLVVYLGTPLALGSWWGLLIFIPGALVIGWRILDEEKFLSERLSGYTEYCQNIRYRLVPLIW
jgi:protein-S-isoprenylcysteine O-methyltransferase Ste14